MLLVQVLNLCQLTCNLTYQLEGLRAHEAAGTPVRCLLLAWWIQSPDAMYYPCCHCAGTSSLVTRWVAMSSSPACTSTCTCQMGMRLLDHSCTSCLVI